MKNPLKTPLLTLSALTLALTPAAFAASGSWDGDTNGNWNNSANWSAAFPNGASDIATFYTSTPNNTISLNGASITAGRIIFSTAGVAGYTFNAGGGTLAIASTSTAGAILIDGTAAAATQTFNPQLLLNGTRYFINDAAGASLNLAGGVANSATGTLQLRGAGGGGVLNGINQTGGVTSLTFANTSGVWEITGSVNATGAVSVAGIGGTARISTDLSSTSGISQTGGTVQINYAGGGLNPSGGYSQIGSLEAFGADRTINTGSHTIGNSSFVGNYSLTIGSLATMNGAGGAITNDIVAGKSLTFNNAGNFSLSESATSRIRMIGGSGRTIISSDIVNGGGSAASGITKTGTGTLQLSGNNSYSGQTQVSGGILLLNSANALPGGIGTTGGTSNLLINGGGVIGLGNGDFSRGLGTGVTQVQFTGATGGGFAAYGGDRNVNLGGASATVTWGSGSFVQIGGSLILGSAESAHKVTFQNGINLNNADRTIQVDNGSGAVDGEISGAISSTNPASGSLAKTGNGTLLLSNVNTYTGLTTVSQGTLLIGTGASIAGGASVASGAALGGNGTIAGAATISGSLRPGNGLGTLAVQNDVTWNAGDAWVFELGTSAASLALANSGGSTQDQLNITGVGSDFLLGTGTSFTFDFAGTGAAGWYKVVDYSGTTDFVAGDFVATNLSSGLSANFVVDAGTSALYINVIPEPGTVGLLTVGLMATLFVRRRRVS